MIRMFSYNPRLLTKQALSLLKSRYSEMPGAIVLSTCQRLEIYVGEGYVSQDTVLHIFRLTSGMDSVFTGDPSIQGQVKRAYCEAMERTKPGKQLHRLFQKALQTGKLVRSQTAISTGAIEYPQASVNMLKARVGHLGAHSIAIAGANALTGSIVHILQKSGISHIALFNRGRIHGERFAEKYGIKVFPLQKVESELTNYSIVITATSADRPLFNAGNTPAGDFCFLDLAIPGDVDRQLAKRQGIQLITLEEVEQQMGRNRILRRSEITRAGKIVNEQVDAFMKWQQTAERSCLVA
jgi:glutamyl-tRNA reductase